MVYRPDNKALDLTTEGLLVQLLVRYCCVVASC